MSVGQEVRVSVAAASDAAVNNNNAAVQPLLKNEMKFLNRPAVDIEFNDLSYTAGRRRIIKGISGAFKSGELTAIMGPSGAGKSSLMNILVGYVTRGVSGTIKTNGEPRRLKIFNKLSSYIMQEDLLQPYLTVKEAMLIAAHLKLGNDYTLEEKNATVDHILKTLGMTSCANTFMERLSGGQRKRVCVSLELVNNPPVIFLDEPTTGLDIVSINQVVQFLKVLARQGRTVICTIHQPSASLFHMFDRVYMVAKGKCIYQGSAPQIVPFLSSINLHCPPTHNPADFVFEVLHNDVIDTMCEIIQNGKIARMENPQGEPNSSTWTLNRMPLPLTKDLDMDFPNTSWQQFKIIFRRMMIQKRRHTTGLWLQVIHHIVSGILVGTIFWGVGNNASRPFENFKFCLCVAVFFMYTHCMTPVLTYPLDVKLMKREYFNRWFSLKPYYIAKTLSTIPMILILGFMFTVIVYIMSDQPMEAKRFFWFALNCSLIALTSEGLGIAIGFTFKSTNGTVVGPSTMAPILMLAMHGMGYGDHIQPFMEWIMKVSYLRYSLVSIITALYLDNRRMICYDDDGPYCHYGDARLLVRDLGMSGHDTSTQLIGILFFLFFFRIVGYLCLRQRVTIETPNQLVNYVTKIIKRK